MRRKCHKLTRIMKSPVVLLFFESVPYDPSLSYLRRSDRPAAHRSTPTHRSRLTSDRCRCRVAYGFRSGCDQLSPRRSTKADVVAGCSLTIVLDRRILLIWTSSKIAFRHVGTVSVWLFQRAG